ncbi:MAG: hypothetical protein HY908_04195 [Myxococcales bacterium]|nr:hypothetical protein [Myxococcales bacterium]
MAYSEHIPGCGAERSLGHLTPPSPSVARRRPARLVLAWLAALAALAVFGWAPRAHAQNECVRCHASLSEKRLRGAADAWRASVHGKDGIGCFGCHGGDPADPTVRAHLAENFKPHPTRQEIPVVCGGCHQDARYIRRFNASLPVDQLTLWQISGHGVGIARADSSAAVCTDCHGIHDILGGSEPNSPVNDRMVPQTCGKCHSDAAAMSGTKLPTDQASGWKRSAHAKALAAGVPGAPACNGCHGGHGELAQTAGSIGRVCRPCHKAEAQEVERSPHKTAFARLGFSDCVPCHGAHDVAAASGALLVSVSQGGACARCHTKDEKPQATAKLLQGMLDDAAQTGDEARRAANEAAARGMSVPGLESALAELRTAEHRLGPAVHALDPSLLEPEVTAVKDAAGVVTKAVAQVEGARKTERLGYYAATGLLALLFGLLVWKSVRVARRRPA